LLGSAVILPISAALQGTRTMSAFIDLPLALASLWILAVTSLLHLLMIWGEISLTHATAHARVAIWEMARGRYHGAFWIGLVLSALGGALPWLAILGYLNPSFGIAGSPLALIGLMLYEHAYVQAGQSVPLA